LVVHFSKYHGTGNDFILIDSRKNVIPEASPALISALCDRHFGIGADGLIFLMPSENEDFRMVYYNADGHEGSMCGNGGRCITAFARASGWILDHARFEAADGLHSADILENGDVRLSLNDVSKVVTLEENYFLDTGSPHLVKFVDNALDMDVVTEGRRYRYDKSFPDGTNVNFVEIKEDHVLVRTYERGVEDETLSCGTGVTAAAIAASRHFKKIASPVKVETRGGTLSVSFSDRGNEIKEVFLTGPATEVFRGTIQI
jgi:diaminopimelate epimerase